MSVYTVYEPALRASEASPDPARFLFVRDGFYFWAFLCAALWMLWHRMWLVLLIYLVVVVGLEYAMHYAGVGIAGIAFVELAVAVLIGLEAGTLRRFTLARRGWKNVGVVSGEDIEDAERRFFDAWVRTAPGGPAPPTPPPVPPAPAPRPPHSPEIVGLFPEPGASR